ncbi:hypothetical protein BDZ45DRAFT_669745 [Acephala macrosclerotiorum]|nr:hypothetical protein BDZ45DRAFT_669745 [Acephala macrosclerotiorum]
MSSPIYSPQKNREPEMKIPMPLSILASELNPPSSSASNSTTSSTTTSRTQSPFTSGTTTPLTESFPPSFRDIRPRSGHLYRVPQLDKNGQPFDVLSRKYSKPEEELDVAEALKSPALPGTFRYALENESKRQGRRREQTPEEKKAEFERVKRELLGLG